MGFSRQEYWSGLPCPPPGDLPNLEIKPTSPALAGGFLTAGPPGDIFHQEASAPLQPSAPLNLSSLRDRTSLFSPSDSKAPCPSVHRVFQCKGGAGTVSALPWAPTLCQAGNFQPWPPALPPSSSRYPEPCLTAGCWVPKRFTICSNGSAIEPLPLAQPQPRISYVIIL